MEKHNLSNLFIALVDGHGRAVWSSNDPDNKVGYVGQSILDVVVVEDREMAKNALSQCLLDGKTVGYTVNLDGDQKQPWRVTLMPIPSMGSALAVCSLLPNNYPNITAEDKNLLAGLGQDMTLKEIARRMHRSESAIDSKIKSLKDKLGCKTLPGLVAMALQAYII